MLALQLAAGSGLVSSTAAPAAAPKIAAPSVAAAFSTVTTTNPLPVSNSAARSVASIQYTAKLNCCSFSRLLTYCACAHHCLLSSWLQAVVQ